MYHIHMKQISVNILQCRTIGVETWKGCSGGPHRCSSRSTCKHVLTDLALAPNHTPRVHMHTKLLHLKANLCLIKGTYVPRNSHSNHILL